MIHFCYLLVKQSQHVGQQKKLSEEIITQDEDALCEAVGISYARHFYNKKSCQPKIGTDV
ncbi:hypothetical protein [Segetibacter aerophilus]|uniref:Uncharacterized protein n=1 Tax=Segetibacter aerophilus TaxID=670293 RepID=A0A512B8M4_9BACT|nr:hypothetical protein [Segetibacter aerophilus]GEO08167.1 hypothetical protein SAE01_06630 [Segetibacter aerophilus]